MAGNLLVENLVANRRDDRSALSCPRQIVSLKSIVRSRTTSRIRTTGRIAVCFQTTGMAIEDAFRVLQ